MLLPLMNLEIMHKDEDEDVAVEEAEAVVVDVVVVILTKTIILVAIILMVVDVVILIIVVVAKRIIITTLHKVKIFKHKIREIMPEHHRTLEVLVIDVVARVIGQGPVVHLHIFANFTRLPLKERKKK